MRFFKNLKLVLRFSLLLFFQLSLSLSLWRMTRDVLFDFHILFLPPAHTVHAQIALIFVSYLIWYSHTSNKPLIFLQLLLMMLKWISTIIYSPKRPRVAIILSAVHLKITLEAPPELPQRLSDVRIGISRAYYFDNLDPQVAGVIERTLDLLRAQGAQLIQVDIPPQLADLYPLFVDLVKKID